MVYRRQFLCFAQEVRVDTKAGGEALHLSVDGGVVDGPATIHVMVGEFGTYHHVLEVDVVTITTGTTGGDDDIGFVLADHLHCLDGSIHGGDAALLENHFVFGE